MKERLQMLKNYLEEEKNIMRFSIICFLLTTLATFLYYTVNNSWKELLHYPEAEYQQLEEEAKRMLTTEDFTPQYPYEIKSYTHNSKTHNLEMQLKYLYKDISITIQVKDYGRRNEVISVKREEQNTQKWYFERAVGFLLTVPFLITLVIDIILMFLLGVWEKSSIAIKKLKEHVAKLPKIS